jgi:hypothetical protein
MPRIGLLTLPKWGVLPWAPSEQTGGQSGRTPAKVCIEKGDSATHAVFRSGLVKCANVHINSKERYESNGPAVGLSPRTQAGGFALWRHMVRAPRPSL